MHVYVTNILKSIKTTDTKITTLRALIINSRELITIYLEDCNTILAKPAKI